MGGKRALLPVVLSVHDDLDIAQSKRVMRASVPSHPRSSSMVVLKTLALV